MVGLGSLRQREALSPLVGCSPDLLLPGRDALCVQPGEEPEDTDKEALPIQPDRAGRLLQRTD